MAGAVLRSAAPAQLHDACRERGFPRTRFSRGNPLQISRMRNHADL